MFGCSLFIVFRRWGERPNERVITVGIGWVLLVSATSGFSGYLKLAYCSRPLPRGSSSSVVRASIRRSWVQFFFFLFFFWGFLYSLRSLSSLAMYISDEVPISSTVRPKAVLACTSYLLSTNLSRIL